MEFQDRSALTRRIAAGFYYSSFEYAGRSERVKFTDPSLELLIEADYHYKKNYDLSRENGIITLEESYEELINSGLWDHEKEIKILGLEEDIKNLQEKLKTIGFRKREERTIIATIKRAKEDVEKLRAEKNQLWPRTAEYYADLAKKKFLVSRITKFDNTTVVIDRYYNILINKYFYEDSITEKQIREIARKDPWRLYWTASKDTGTPLFNSPSVEMTELQYALVTWTKVYEFAFESERRPTQEVIEDDDQFDVWYQEECSKLDAEVRENSLKHKLGVLDGNFGSNEVFLPADAEGAKEVYALNDTHSRIRVQERQAALQKHGVLKEAELPDMKREIRMAMNRQGNEAIKNFAKR